MKNKYVSKISFALIIVVFVILCMIQAPISDAVGSLWSLLPPDNKLLARVYGIAGIHRYAVPRDLLLANDSYVEFHPFKPGDKTIKLPAKKHVTNPYDNTDYGYTDTITLRNLPKGKNILLKLE